MSRFAAYLPLGMLMLCLPAIGLTGYYYYVQQTRHIEQAILEQLSSIGDLKAQQITDWLVERKADAEVLTNSPAGVVSFLLHPGADRQSREALDWLSAWLKHYHYRKIRVVDAAGMMRLSLPERTEPPSPVLLVLAREAMRTRKVMISSFYRAPNGQIYLDIIAPTYQENNAVAAGAVLVSVDPHDFLFPIIRSWPTPSPTAETLLVQREGNEVVYLNELRHRRNAPLSLRLPLDKPDLPAAMAARGKTGPAYSVDYRGIPVLAELRNVPDTPWHIVAKIDREEIYAPVRESALRTVLIVAMLALLASAAAWLLWRRQSEAKLLASRMRLEHLLSTNPAMIYSLSPAAEEPHGPFRPTFVSANIEAMLGYTPAECFGNAHWWRDNLHPDDREEALARQPEIFLQGGLAHEYRFRRKDGAYLWVHDKLALLRDAAGQPLEIVGSWMDITDLKYAESTIKHMAYYDPLTSLPNRRLLRDRLEQAVIGARRDGDMLAVMHLDLDRFKLVNDTLGHDAGDQLLKAVAQRLADCLREGDTIARLNADEFVIVARHLAHTEDAVGVAEKIIDALQQPFVLQDHEFFISASIGICIFPADTDEVDTLLKNADIVLHQAKAAGRNNFRFFSAEMNVATLGQLELETELRHALERKEFVLHYQPQVDIASGKTVGVEALIRWMHPGRGLVPPAEFIPLAEETGLILPLGEWVLKTACSQMREWQDAGLPAVRVAVNLSARHFRQPGLVATVARILHETRLAPQYLELEITEGTIMLNVERTIAVLHELKALGVELSVDDFGTGYSSLSYLKRFPVNTLKIDQSFVRDITTDPEDAALARAIIAMAHSLHLRVIAEGVETEGQLGFLASHHCDEIQGYFFSRPLPAEECMNFLQQSRLPLPSGGKAEQRTLLLVDDEVNIATSLKRLLRGDGYRILTAGSGREGLELLAANRAGVIVSDQRMPEMTGVEFLRRVKELYPDTMRIVLSGYTDLKSVTDAINEGAIYKFLTKPWEDEQLRDNVREAFQRYELKQENTRLSREIERANSELSEINRDLEWRVAEKTQEIRHSINVLQVSQEVLEHLPTAVIGIDEDGLIVMANHQADALFANDGGPLLGCEARARLPVAFADCIDTDESGAHTVTLAAGRRLHVRCHRMGEMCRSKGTVLVLSPVDGE